MYVEIIYILSCDVLTKVTNFINVHVVIFYTINITQYYTQTFKASLLRDQLSVITDFLS